jgi:Ulp1 family protease
MRMFNYPDGISNSTNTLTRTSPRSDYPVGCTLTEHDARSLAPRQYINDSIIEFLFENLKRYTSNERCLYVSPYCIGTLLNLNKPC